MLTTMLGNSGARGEVSRSESVVFISSSGPLTLSYFYGILFDLNFRREITRQGRRGPHGHVAFNAHVGSILENPYTVRERNRERLRGWDGMKVDTKTRKTNHMRWTGDTIVDGERYKLKGEKARPIEIAEQGWSDE
jgi:hypothetical protein